jgi:hypothetical protein
MHEHDSSLLTGQPAVAYIRFVLSQRRGGNVAYQQYL